MGTLEDLILSIKFEPTLNNDYDARPILLFYLVLGAAYFLYPVSSPNFIFIAFIGVIASTVATYATAAASSATAASVGTYAATATTYQAAVYATAYAATQIAATYALQAASKELQDSGNQKGGGDIEDRTRTVRNSIEPRKIIYGKQRVGGSYAYIAESDDNKYLHLVVCYADHEIKSFDTIWFNGDKLSLDNNGFDTTSTYDGLIRVNKHLGASDQSADSDLKSEAPNNEWTSDHRLRGVAYLYVRLEWDANAFKGGLPNISALIEGKNDIYDPRDDTNKYTRNPALCIRDYLTDEVRGLGADSSEINTDEVKTSADDCETQIDLKGGGTQDKYLMDGEIKLDKQPMDVLRDMNTSMDGLTSYSLGEFFIRSGRDTSSVLELDETDVNDNLKVTTKRSRRQLFNRIKGTYISAENDWKPADFPAIKDSTALSKDNDEKRWKNIELPFTIEPAMAQRIAKYDLSRNRQQKSIQGLFGMRAMELIPGDVFKFTLDRYGWDKKKFKVQSWSLAISEDGDGNPRFGIELSAREWASSVYNWDETSDEQDVSNAPESTLPDPSDVSSPSNLSLTSGDDTLLKEEDGTIVPRIKTTWNAPNDEFVTSGGEIEIQYKKSADSTYETYKIIEAENTLAYVQPVDSGVDYDVRIRSISTFGFKSDWVTVTNHTVIGKEALPADVAVFGASQNGTRINLSWKKVSEPDIQGYLIKYGERSNSDWESARTLTEEESGTGLTSEQVPPGDYTFYIKAEDTSGNQSENAATANLDVISDFNVLHERQYAPAWLDDALGDHGETGILEAGSWGLEAYGDFTWGASGETFVKAYNGNLRVADSKKASEYDYELFDNYCNNPVSVSGYQGETHDVGKEVTTRLYANITGGKGPGEGGEFSPTLQIRAWNEGENPPSFENWTTGNKTARYFQFRLKLNNDDGETSYISGFEQVADAQDRTEKGEVDIDSSGQKTISFDDAFVNTPNVIVSAEASSGVIATKSDVTTDDFEGHLTTESGNDTSGTLTWRAEGV